MRLLLTKTHAPSVGMTSPPWATNSNLLSFGGVPTVGCCGVFWGCPTFSIPPRTGPKCGVGLSQAVCRSTQEFFSCHPFSRRTHRRPFGLRTQSIFRRGHSHNAVSCSDSNQDVLGKKLPFRGVSQVCGERHKLSALHCSSTDDRSRRKTDTHLARSAPLRTALSGA